MIIKHKETKIKRFEESIIQQKPAENSQDYFILIIIILVAFSSFGLGRLSTIENTKKRPVVFEQSLPAATLSAKNTLPENQSIQEGSLVASKNGTKYHFPWCSGAQRIKEENKIWFNSTKEAREGGYTPAANCKGLK